MDYVGTSGSMSSSDPPSLPPVLPPPGLQPPAVVQTPESVVAGQASSGRAARGQAAKHEEIVGTHGGSILPTTRASPFLVGAIAIMASFRLFLLVLKAVPFAEELSVADDCQRVEGGEDVVSNDRCDVVVKHALAV